jgi:hypothetical protein
MVSDCDEVGVSSGPGDHEQRAGRAGRQGVSGVSVSEASPHTVLTVVVGSVGNEIGCRQGEPTALIQILEFGAPANAFLDGIFLGQRARSRWQRHARRGFRQLW